MGDADMYSIEDIRKEYDRLDSLCGVDTSNVEIKISTRAYRRYGYCLFHKKRRKYYPTCIMITDFILTLEEEFWDIIRHEYAHALVTLRDGIQHGHDKVWKQACLEVGCPPDVHTESEKAFDLAVAKKMSTPCTARPFIYQIECKQCHRVWKYKSNCKVVQSARVGTATCPFCNVRDFIVLDIS